MAVPKKFIYGTFMCHLQITIFWKVFVINLLRIELLSNAPKLELLYRRQNNIGKRNILPTSFKIV